MNPDFYQLIAIITLTLLLLLFTRCRTDSIALLIIIVLGILQLLPKEDLFSGFASQTVMSLLAIMMVSKGLDKAGFTHILVAKLTTLQISADKMVYILMLLAGIMAAFLQNFGAVVLFLPIVNLVSLHLGIDKSRVLLPVCFSAILGSNMTLIGSSPMLLLVDLMPEAPIGLLTVFPIGVILLIIGFIYFKFFGFATLTKIRSIKHSLTDFDYFRQTYGVGDNYYELVVDENSPLINMTIKQFEKNFPHQDLVIIGVTENNNLELPPLRRKIIGQGMHIAVLATESSVKELAERYHCTILPKLTLFSSALSLAHAGICELVISPSSPLVGQSFNTLHLRRNFNIQAIAVHRGKRIRRGTELRKVILKPGDTLCVFCRWRDLTRLEDNNEFLIITSHFPRLRYKSNKLPIALSLMILAVLAITIFKLAVPVALFSVVVCMLLFKIMELDDAYQAVSWATLWQLAGFIALGQAAQTTGLADFVANNMVEHCQAVPVIVFELLLAAFVSICAQLITNVGATVLLVPLAVPLAAALNVPVLHMLLLVGFSANNVFLLPNHQATMLIMSMGNYTSRDFLRSGWLLWLIYIGVTVLLINWLI